MENLEKIKKELPRGWQTKVASKAGVTLMTVHRVIKGKSKNAEVLKALAEYIEELKNTENTIQSLLD